MKRFIMDKLIDWQKSNSRKPLILKGARQVGKTYILKQIVKVNIKMHKKLKIKMYKKFT